MIKSIQLIPEVNNKLEQFKGSLDVLIKQNNEYFNGVKRYSNKEFIIEEKEGESFEEEKNKIETMMDQLEDIKKRTELELQNIESFEHKFNELKNQIDTLKNNYLNEKKECENKIYQFERKIVNKIDELEKNALKQHEEEMEKIKNQYKQMRNQYPLNSKLNDMMLENKEMKQIEEWTNKKYSEVIFDSDKDDWSENEPFKSRVLNKSNLIFLIEDFEGQKFGGYINAKIDKALNKGNGWENGSAIEDPNAFVFSLNSNGRLNGMMKFGIKDKTKAFLLNDSNETWLFLIGRDKGNDICIEKQPNKSKSYCANRNFNYENNENALIGKVYPNNYFTPKRFVVIQMI